MAVTVILSVRLRVVLIPAPRCATATGHARGRRSSPRRTSCSSSRATRRHRSNRSPRRRGSRRGPSSGTSRARRTWSSTATPSRSAGSAAAGRPATRPPAARRTRRTRCWGCCGSTKARPTARCCACSIESRSFSAVTRRWSPTITQLREVPPRPGRQHARGQLLAGAFMGAIGRPAARHAPAGDPPRRTSPRPSSSYVASTGRPRASRLISARHQGTTGFDVVGSWGRLRVGVPEAPLKTGQHKCGQESRSVADQAHEYALAA